MNDGGPAFPLTASTGDPRDGVYCTNGMTLRDYFAAKAMAGLASNSAICSTADSSFPAWIAKRAFEIADAMIEQRDKNIEK